MIKPTKAEKGRSKCFDKNYFDKLLRTEYELSLLIFVGENTNNCVMKSRLNNISNNTVKINAFNYLILTKFIVYLIIFIGFMVLFYVGGLKINFTTALSVFLMFYVFYLGIFRDFFISLNKIIRLEDEFIFVNKRRFKKKDAVSISVTVSSAGINGIVISYHVNIVFSFMLFKNKPLIVFGKKEQAIDFANEIGKFLSLDVIDNTSS